MGNAQLAMEVRERPSLQILPEVGPVLALLDLTWHKYLTTGQRSIVVGKDRSDIITDDVFFTVGCMKALIGPE